MFALVDCNNFFVSCERVFQPSLLGRPVVVLSSGDGCVVALSPEAKQIGLTRGMPFFQMRHLCQSGQAVARSGNMVLYGDMSRRVMATLRSLGQPIEVASVDEAFLLAPPAAERSGEELAAWGRMVARRVERATGIPVSVGIAPTKTLAKVAARFAKKYKGYQGAAVIAAPEQRERALSLTPIADVWGVGRRLAERLTVAGLATALDMARWPERTAREWLTAPGLATWRELQGVPVLSLELTTAARQSLTASRTLPRATRSLDDLLPMVARFATTLSVRLRAEHTVAREVTVYILTDRFHPELGTYCGLRTLQLPVATSDLRELASAASSLLREAFRPEFAYKKVGLSLTRITPYTQGNLFDQTDRPRQQRLLRAIDAVRSRQGRAAVGVASSTAPPPKAAPARAQAQPGHAAEASTSAPLPQQAAPVHRSPCFSTRLADAIEVRV